MKAKISTAVGTFEFEGDDNAVKEQIRAVLELSTKVPIPVPTQPNQNMMVKSISRQKKSPRARSAATLPRMLPTLLSGKEEVDSLRKYYTDKKPETHIEKFAVLTLWLRDNKAMDSASIDEMWTLYKVLGLRQPKSMIQTFRDGKSKKSYFESADGGRYFITSYGETYVDHDLPAIKEQK